MNKHDCVSEDLLESTVRKFGANRIRKRRKRRVRERKKKTPVAQHTISKKSCKSSEDMSNFFLKQQILSASVFKEEAIHDQLQLNGSH